VSSVKLLTLLINTYSSHLAITSHLNPSHTSTVELVSHNTLSHRCATNKYFQVIGSIHDIESYSALDNTSSLNEHLFTPHWVHLSIIPSWLSSILFHLAWHRTYTLWVNNPLASLQISHDIYIWEVELSYHTVEHITPPTP
jgi:hypothetical protein